ncbi:hypothetical protein WICMUC_005661 [Wickerhamomyces mucosus]|uniref:Uncharacterized protein n=1 Tax=Wickerhamomyces mucosus TaxID=1378264 RepID=A0A9P8T4W9_9ASCO|nr:hypothetical protein WICMUC_005661 [Wickerhamomyces mucosus]
MTSSIEESKRKASNPILLESLQDPPKKVHLEVTSDILQKYIHQHSLHLTKLIKILDELREIVLPFVYKINEDFNQLILFNTLDNEELYSTLNQIFKKFDLFYEALEKLEKDENDLHKSLSWDENLTALELVKAMKEKGLTL